jgi:hypothetical protein
MGFIQSNYVDVYSGTGRLTDTVAYSSNVTAGDLLVCVATAQTASPSSVADTQGNTWTALPVIAANENVRLFYAIAGSTGANTVTITYSASNAVYTAACIAEYSGYSYLGPSNSAKAAGTSGSCNSGNISLTQTALVIGYATLGFQTWTAGSGFTARLSSGPLLFEDVVGAAVGTTSASATFTPTYSSNYGCGVVAFYPDSSLPTFIPQAPIVLSTGALARYPMSIKSAFQTRTNIFADSSRQTFSQIPTPLSNWVLNLALLQDSEANDWRDFYEQMLGAATPFTFVDPSDNLFNYSEALEMGDNNPWTFEGSSTTVAVEPTLPDPFGIISGRVRQANLVGSQSGAVYQILPIYPGGSGESRTNGLTFTVSGYLQKVSGGLTSVNIFLEGSDESEFTETICTLGTSWQRFSVTHQFAPTNSAPGIAAGIIVYSGSGLVNVFGLQCEAAGAVSQYKRRNAYNGFHPICYFKTDEFSKQATEFNVNTIQQLEIEESN